MFNSLVRTRSFNVCLNCYQTIQFQCVFFFVYLFVNASICNCAVAANAYELNNLDNEALDAPIFTMVGGSGTVGKHQNINGAVLDRATTLSDFASLPCESVLVACKKSESSDGVCSGGAAQANEFVARNHPIYQSAHAQSMTGQVPVTLGRKTLDGEAGSDCVDGPRNGGK